MDIAASGDGVSTRAIWQSLLGGLIFKVTGLTESYLDIVLRPYEHYIPVRRDLSDLREKLLFFLHHDEL